MSEFSTAYSAAFGAQSAPVEPPGALLGPCDWPIDTACLAADWDSLSDSVRHRSVALASATLHRLSGYRVGGCPVTVRPCKQGCTGAYSGTSYVTAHGYYTSSGFWPHIEGGMWVNSCGCHGSCSCGAECRVSLPGPVGRVDEVKVDGLVVPPADYRIDGDGILWTGLAIECPWPTCQDMALPDTEVGTFSVTYLNAWPVDSMGAYAAGIMAMEFARACTGGKCRLPQGVTQVTRQGISLEIAAGSFPGGVTGIREVDAVIAMWNPKPLRQAPTVWSPDLHQVRVDRS